MLRPNVFPTRTNVCAYGRGGPADGSLKNRVTFMPNVLQRPKRSVSIRFGPARIPSNHAKTGGRATCAIVTGDDEFKGFPARLRCDEGRAGGGPELPEGFIPFCLRRESRWRVVVVVDLFFFFFFANTAYKFLQPRPCRRSRRTFVDRNILPF